MESGPAAWQTDKINAKINKDIVVPEKEQQIFLSLLVSIPSFSLAAPLAVICSSSSLPS